MTCLQPAFPLWPTTISRHISNSQSKPGAPRIVSSMYTHSLNLLLQCPASTLLSTSHPSSRQPLQEAFLARPRQKGHLHCVSPNAPSVPFWRPHYVFFLFQFCIYAYTCLLSSVRLIHLLSPSKCLLCSRFCRKSKDRTGKTRSLTSRGLQSGWEINSNNWSRLHIPWVPRIQEMATMKHLNVVTGFGCKHIERKELG